MKSTQFFPVKLNFTPDENECFGNVMRKIYKHVHEKKLDFFIIQGGAIELTEHGFKVEWDFAPKKKGGKK